MKKRIMYIILVILIILFVAEIILLNKAKSKPNNIEEKKGSNTIENTDLNKTVEDNNNTSLYITNEYMAFANYKGTIQIKDFEKSIYKFVIEDVPKILNETKDLDNEKISKYYDDNVEKIRNDYNINKKIDYYFIAKNVKEIFFEENQKVNELKVDKDSIKNSENNIIFDLDVLYTGNYTLKLQITLIGTSGMQIGSGTEIKKKLEELEYSNIDYVKMDTDIANMVNYLPKIYLDLNLKGRSYQKQYYDLHKNKMNSVGIYSQDDLVNINAQISQILKINEQKFVGYDIDETTTEKVDENYDSINLIITYNTSDNLNLKIYLSKNSSVVPRYKFGA